MTGSLLMTRITAKDNPELMTLSDDF